MVPGGLTAVAGGANDRAMGFHAPLRISDFRVLREEGATYVDKTAFISEVLGSRTQALLIPRPRRFGKTLNLSALRYFLEHI